MRDIGGLIWVILVVIGIISSIRSNVKKAQKARAQSPRPAPAQSQVQRVIQTMEPAYVDLAAMPVVPQPVQQPVQVQRVRPPRPPAVPFTIPSALPEVDATVRTAHSVRGMFGRGSIVRAIVAAEVLGPPKSEQERSIWSPRHNEPSI